MKTFKQHVKEGYKQDKYGAGNVGSATSDAVEDGSIGAHNIQDPDVLKRVNAFVGSIAEREYMKPQFAIDELREKLHRIGLTVSSVDMTGDKGNAYKCSLSFKTGRDGDTLDDFIDHGAAFDDIDILKKYCMAVSVWSDKETVKLVENF